MQEEMHFYSSWISNSILYMKIFTFFETCCLTRYFKWERKGKHIKSKDTYFQQDLHSAFTILSNIWIIERELTSGKISLVFYFLFLWNTVLGGAVFVLCFMWRICSNDIKTQLAPPWFTCTQLASPWLTYTYDRLMKSFGVNLILIILFTTCKMGIHLWVIDFWFGWWISGR